MPLLDLFDYYDSLVEESERRNKEYKKQVNKEKR
jgi:hypothetical protein